MTSAGHWYAALRHVYVDVVGDFAGAELAVLDGDALLAMVLRSLNGGFPLRVGGPQWLLVQEPSANS